MTKRERLIELLEKAIRYADEKYSDEKGFEDKKFCGFIADYLLANGVIVPPCKVGDTVYSINKTALKGHWEDNRYIVDEWSALKVCEIPFSLTLWECGWSGIFLSREKAEKALAERSKNE